MTAAYFIDGQITSNGVVVYPPFCSWSWCVPGGVAGATVINGSASTTEFSYNAGLGIDFKCKEPRGGPGERRTA